VKITSKVLVQELPGTIVALAVFGQRKYRHLSHMYDSLKKPKRIKFENRLNSGV